MASVNKAIVVGNLGKDPEIRYTQNNTPVCTFSVATTDRWTDQQGNPQERTEWHRIVAWAKLAEICEKYLHKGKQVYIEGSMQTREWEDQNGNKRYTTEIKAREMQMLGTKADRDAQQGGGDPGPSQGDYQQPSYPEAPGPGPDDDDLPF